MSSRVEPNLTEDELAHVDAMVASGRFPNRGAAILELLRLGLETTDTEPGNGE